MSDAQRIVQLEKIINLSVSLLQAKAPRDLMVKLSIDNLLKAFPLKILEPEDAHR